MKNNNIIFKICFAIFAFSCYIFGLLKTIESVAYIITFIMIGLFAIVIIFGMIPGMIEEKKRDKKLKEKREFLEFNARFILKNNASNSTYKKILSNTCFVKWFTDGFIDGVENGIEKFRFNRENNNYEPISLEENVRLKYIEHCRPELLGGDAEFCKFAFLEGIKKGAENRNLKKIADRRLD